MSQHVTIMRRWNHPQINITLDEDGISIKMDLNDFLAALQKEIGKVTWTFTESTFAQQFTNAVNNVLTAMKRETLKVVS